MGKTLQTFAQPTALDFTSSSSSSQPHREPATRQESMKLSKPSLLLKHSWSRGRAKERFHFNDAGNGAYLQNPGLSLRS
jgi:hypothetical protein